MEKIYACTIRPFDCKHWRENSLCGDDNSEKVCEYAREAPITADDIEPDMIDREILANLRRLGAKNAGFMFDGSISEEQQEDDRTIAVLRYALEQAEKKGVPETIYSTTMNTNHEFPHDIAKALEALKFEKKELRYYGKPNNYKVKDAIIEFGIDGDSLMCKDVTSMKPIFIVDSAIGLGYFLVLLQAYGIYHKRYVYERVDGILEQFIYDQED